MKILRNKVLRGGSAGQRADMNSQFISWAFFVKYVRLINVMEIQKKCQQVYTQNF